MSGVGERVIKNGGCTRVTSTLFSPGSFEHDLFVGVFTASQPMEKTPKHEEKYHSSQNNENDCVNWKAARDRITSRKSGVVHREPEGET